MDGLENKIGRSFVIIAFGSLENSPSIKQDDQPSMSGFPLQWGYKMARDANKN